MYGRRTLSERAPVRGGEHDDELYCPPWLELAMAYVPYQPMHPKKMSPEDALKHGTLYPALYRPLDHYEYDRHHHRHDHWHHHDWRRGADA